MNEPPMSAPQRTAPVSVVLGAIASLRQAIIPALAIGFSGIGEGVGRGMMAIGVGLAAAVIGTAISYFGWRRLTYTIGDTDIRVESGVLSRSARSVPYERIQDVSLEAKPLPRLFGLVAVKFETGAGGGEDLALQYLTTAQGERLRQLVRERREEEQLATGDEGETSASSSASSSAIGDDGEVLFAMSSRRLLTFGLFQFSLAVFAVLGGLLQYVDNVVDVDVWSVDLWRNWLEEQGSVVASLGPFAQAAGAVAGLAGLIAIGFVTGLVRTALRDWGFTLTRSPRGFRRQRGLLTRIDVVMPAHRVQALVIGTGLLRYRFGWHGLSFVSLAQDDKNESHVVVPFAKMDEIAPVVAAAGFHLSDAATGWQKASKRYLIDRAALSASGLLALALGAAIFAPFGVAFIPIGIAVLVVGANFYAWEFRRHALDDSQIFATTGLMSPTSRIATRLRLHSVEIGQGLLAQWGGYATVHLGLAGGTFSIPGVPLAEARMLRASVLETIAATDYSRLDQAFSEDHSGFSENFLAT
jgi:putative membrane protein